MGAGAYAAALGSRCNSASPILCLARTGGGVAWRHLRPPASPARPSRPPQRCGQPCETARLCQRASQISARRTVQSAGPQLLGKVPVRAAPSAVCGAAAAMGDPGTAVLEVPVSDDEAPGPSGRSDGAAGRSCHPAISRAAAVLRAGGVVAIPTETVYGLAANALSASAVAKIFEAKRRPPDNPLIVHISSLDMLRSLYPPGWRLPAVYDAALAALWPGPLTVLLPRSDKVPGAVTCGQPTMAVRMPAHPVALRLIEACGFPLAAPSANSSGRPSPTLASHVLADLDGRISLIIDGGPCTCGVESTVLDGLRVPPAILRPGGVTHEQLCAFPGLEQLQVYARHFVDAGLEAAPTTPGMKYRHYSPTAQVVLLDPGEGGGMDDSALRERLAAALESTRAELRAAGVERIGVLRTSLPASTPPGMMTATGRAQPVAAQATDGVDGSPTTHGSAPTTSHPGATAAGHPATSCPDGHHDNAAAAAAVTATDAADPSLSSSTGQGNAAPAAMAVAARHATPPVPTLSLEYVLGPLSQPGEVARELFKGLRALDEAGVEAIVVEGVRDSSEGLAVMNRLRKAASRVVQVRVPGR